VGQALHFTIAGNSDADGKAWPRKSVAAVVKMRGPAKAFYGEFFFSSAAIRAADSVIPFRFASDRRRG